MPAHRSGFVAIIGRPNVGKSTLINRLTGERIAIVSPKPQTTRNRITGIVTRPDHQIAFLDTPGVHDAKGELNRAMVLTALTALADVDAVLFLVEAASRRDGTVDVGRDNEVVLSHLKRAGKPAVLGINKIDLVLKPRLLPVIDTYRRLFPFAEIVPISASKGDGVRDLEEALAKLLPEGPALFPEDMVTDAAERFMVEELIREQVLRLCRDEVPYATAVVVDHFDESEREPDPAREVRKGTLAGLVRLDATVYVERESQKAIVIGKRGQMLKQIGTDARKQIERLLGAHVYLHVLVKVEREWSERRETLRRFGYQR
jgi:GTP-binding protein Era